MLVGAHAIVYSKDAEADRAFFRDQLGLASTDAGEGWLIFGLPPAELAVHPANRNDQHEIYLMVEDVDLLIRTMRRKGIRCSPVREAGWGRLTRVTLPGGGKLGIYQPQHPRAPRVRRPRERGASRSSRRARPR